MLVQALQYQNTACERRTAGRHTKSIAPGRWFCVVSERGRGFLPPTASWNQDRLLKETFCDVYGHVGNSGTSTVLQSVIQPFISHHILKTPDVSGCRAWKKKMSLSHEMRISENSITAPNNESLFCSKNLQAGESENQVTVTGKARPNDFSGIWEKEKTEVFSSHIWFTSHLYSWQCRRREMRQKLQSSRHITLRLD